MALVLDTSSKSIANTGIIQVLKGCESLIIETNQTFANLTNVKVRILIQRPTEKDILITEGGLLPFSKVAILASTGESAISLSPEGLYSYKIDLTTGGNLPLRGGETLRFEFQGLDSTKNWQVYTLESFADATHVYRYGQQILNTTDRKQDYVVTNYDAVLIDKNAGVDYYRITYANGAQVEHTQVELDTLARSIDPIQLIDSTGAVKTGFTNLICLPTHLISIIQVNKDDTTQWNLYYREIA